MKEAKKTNKLQEGAAILLFVSLMTVLTILFFAMFQSVSISSLRRSMAVSDTVKSIYEAESEVNDIFARFMLGYTISEDEIPPEGKEIKVGDTTLFIKVTEQDGVQEVEVTAGRLYATNKLRGVRESGSEITDIDIILGLDCTASMNWTTTGDDSEICHEGDSSCKSRFTALKEALSIFMKSIDDFDYSDNVHLGILVFRDEAEWIKHESGDDVRPDSGLALWQVKKAIEDGFEGYYVGNSSACGLVAGTTSVGAPYAKAHDYFDEQRASGNPNLQVEIVITDGDPNTKSSLNSLVNPYKCNPDKQCYVSEYDPDDPYYVYQGKGSDCLPYARNMLRCVLATKDTKIYRNTVVGNKYIGYEEVRDFSEPGYPFKLVDEQYGIRDPEINAYGVTIYKNVRKDVVESFRFYLGTDNYYGIDDATQLGGVLDIILEEVLEEFSNIKFYREIPLGED